MSLRATPLLALPLLAGCSPPPPPAVEIPPPPPAAAAPDAGDEAPPPSRARIAAGDRHTCVSTARGEVFCWGDNSLGQIGDGTLEPRPSPVRIPLSGVIDLAASDRQTCALLAGGRVRCWGGDRAHSAPAEVAGLSGARALAVGDDHACALLPHGDVHCWGQNFKGQLGLPVNDTIIAPPDHHRHDAHRVPGVEDAVGIAAGADSTCAVLRSGKVTCWGVEPGRGLHLPMEVTGLPSMRAVRMHADQFCGLSDDGRVFCWGTFMVLHDHAPSSRPLAVGEWSGVVELSVGALHRCALLADGAVSCMGSGPAFGGKDWESTPIVVQEPAKKAVEVAAGRGFTCVLDASGAVACVGTNRSGELGIGETGTFPAPRGEVPGVEDAVAVMPAAEAACALRKDGNVVCWGAGLAADPHDSRPHAIPAEPVPGLPPVRALFRGPEWTSLCGATAAGDLYCFQAGLVGRDGDASRRARRVVGLRDVVDVSQWPRRSGVAYAVLRSGAVVAFEQSVVQRDDKTLEVVTAPLRGLRGVAQISADAADLCARHKDGTVSCVPLVEPFDTAGRPVLAATTVTPVVVQGVAGVVDLGRGDGWAARTRAGVLYAFGRVGPGFRAAEDPGMRGVVAMSHVAGFYAVMPDGGVVSHKDREGRSRPLVSRVEVGPAIAVESSWFADCLVRPNGKVACWGSNHGGACGSAERAFSSELVPVKLPAE